MPGVVLPNTAPRSNPKLSRPSAAGTKGPLERDVMSMRETTLLQLSDGVFADAKRMLAAFESMPPYHCLAAHDPRLASQIYHAHPGLSHVDVWGIAVALDRQESLLAFYDARQGVCERLR